MMLLTFRLICYPHFSLPVCCPGLWRAGKDSTVVSRPAAHHVEHTSVRADNWAGSNR